jgi:hypothetical protein
MMQLRRSVAAIAPVRHATHVETLKASTAAVDGAAQSQAGRRCNHFEAIEAW